MPFDICYCSCCMQCIDDIIWIVICRHWKPFLLFSRVDSFSCSDLLGQCCFCSFGGIASRSAYPECSAEAEINSWTHPTNRGVASQRLRHLLVNVERNVAQHQQHRGMCSTCWMLCDTEAYTITLLRLISTAINTYALVVGFMSPL